MVARAGGDDAAGPFLLAKVRDLGVGTSMLVAEHGLQVLPLEQDLVPAPAGQPRSHVERRLARDVVHTALENVVEEVWQSRVHAVSEAVEQATRVAQWPLRCRGTSDRSRQKGRPEGRP